MILYVSIIILYCVKFFDSNNFELFNSCPRPEFQCTADGSSVRISLWALSFNQRYRIFKDKKLILLSMSKQSWYEIQKKASASLLTLLWSDFCCWAMRAEKGSASPDTDLPVFPAIRRAPSLSTDRAIWFSSLLRKDTPKEFYVMQIFFA